MFDTVRNNKRAVQIFLGLITLPFAFFGVESYVRSASSGDEVAKVGDGKITQNQFQQAMREQQDQMRQMLRERFNPEMLNTPFARRQVLDQLINQRVLLLEAQKRNLMVSDAALRDFIAAIPSLQDNGKFSPEKYKAAVAAQGMSEEYFEAELRRDLTLRQLMGAVGDTVSVSKAAQEVLAAALAEKRTVQEVRFSPEAFMAQAVPTDEAVRKYYDDNKKQFETPEQVRAEFVVLSMEALRSQAQVKPEEVKARYEAQKDKLQSNEERRASHILIAADKGNADARAKAKAKAAELLAQVKAKPAEFGKLASANSQDPGSAKQGGDLGFFGRGAMVKPFEDAAFALKEGQVSDVVETDFGYHIIQVTGIKAARGKSFDEVKGELEAELKAQAAQRLYAEAAEGFSNLVYEQSDSLKAVQDKYKLAVQQTGWLIKGAPAQPGSPFANPKLIGALFGDDAVKNKRNTEAVEVAPNTLAAARVLEHKPAAVRPLETVQAEIKTMLQRQEAGKLAEKAGAAKLAECQAGKCEASFGPAIAVSRSAPATLPRDAVKAVFKVSAKTLPAYAGAAQPMGGYALYKVSAVDTSAKLDPVAEKRLSGQILQVLAQTDVDAFLNSLKARYKVEVNQAALDAKAQ